MNLEDQFKNYLLQERELSRRTVKNYLSDFSNFWNWLDLALPKIDKISQKITLNSLKRYRKYLSSTELAKSTVKRRLSTVRIFCQFLLSQGMIKTDPSIELENPSEDSPEDEKIDNLVTKFERYLDNQGLSRNTAKNYLADVKNYLEWAVDRS